MFNSGNALSGCHWTSGQMPSGLTNKSVLIISLPPGAQLDRNLDYFLFSFTHAGNNGVCPTTIRGYGSIC